MKQSRNKLSNECKAFSDKLISLNNKLLKQRLTEKQLSRISTNNSILYVKLISFKGKKSDSELLYIIVKQSNNSSLLEFEINEKEINKRHKMLIFMLI